MSDDLHYLAYSAVLTWVMLMFASLARARAWTLEGMGLALGNRDKMPDPTPLSGRAHRAAKNMLENLVLFAVVIAVARLGGIDPAKIATGAALFFWARVAYFVVYILGVPYVRTVVWAASVAGLVMILMASH